MIQANELRIGNYIQESYEGLAEQVYDIVTGDEAGIGDEFESINGEEADYFKPIPLTEEWLVKLGATEVGVDTGLFKLDRFYLQWLELYKYWYVTESIDSAYITKVEFVHEWQNVVFTLNGQELEVKP